MAKSSIPQYPPGSYVYAIVVDGVVRYIGKGTGRRVAGHLTVARLINRKRSAGENVKARRFYNKLAKALRSNSSVECRIIVSGLSSEEAFAKEIEAIADAPRCQLWNELSGGQGLSSEDARRMWSNPEYRQRVIALRTTDEFRRQAREKNIAHFANPNEREKSRVRSRAMWEDPSFREKGTKALRAIWESHELRKKHKRGIAKAWTEHPERRQARAEITKTYSARPGYRERAGERFKELWKDPEFRKNATAHWTDPERKKAIVASWSPEFLEKRGRAIAEGHAKSEASQKRWADPVLQAKLRTGNDNYWKSPEARKRHSAKMKALWADPVHRAKTTAHWAEKRKAKDGRS